MTKLEEVAQVRVDCGDGSTVQLRFAIAEGLISLSQGAPKGKELTRVDALRLAYDVLRTALGEEKGE